MNANEINDERLIQEFADLLKISNFRRPLFHKVFEIKNIIAEDVSLYQEEQIFDENEIKVTDEGALEFFLHRFGEILWIPHIPGIKYNPFTIIPQGVIDFIVSEAQPSVISIKSKLIFEKIPGRIFDLSFERVAARKITGTIEIKKCGVNQEGTVISPVEISTEFEHKPSQILEIFHFMFEDQVFFDRVMNEFTKWWRPRLKRSQTSTG
ncbi:MAG: hypothetical protein GY950_04080 [bacterium]|nr:hypothetical protein [bacterium]